MNAIIRHPIRYVASQTGIKPHLIRAWEERYGAVSPERTSGNRRLYSDADINRLKLLKWVVQQGHAISAVARLSDADLEALAGQSGWSGPDPYVTGNEVPKGSGGNTEASCRSTIKQALNAVVQLNHQALEKVLNDATVEMPRHRFLRSVIVPLFREIGSLWRSGRLKTINEHMASLVVRAILWDMLRSAAVSDAAPRIVIATPEGHWHEFGALAAALAATESGWHACYYGPNLPAEEIAFAVKKTDAAAVSLSLCHTMGDTPMVAELKLLRRLIGKEIPIIVGGAGNEALAASVRAVDAQFIIDLDAYRTLLESIRR